MKWHLRTTNHRADGIFSELWLDDTQFSVTLEHAYQSGDEFAPKLPRGTTYLCKRGDHRLDHYQGGRQFSTFEITEVPGHSGILFHPGNFNRDSDGCVLLGAEIVQGDPWWVSHSILTFQTFLHLTEGTDSFELEVS
jgi:hypothetical protein